MDKTIDCIVCGSCTVDIVVRPMSLGEPIGVDRLHRTDPICATTGGIVSNAGAALAKLGARVAALSRVGDDPWGRIIEENYQSQGIDTTALERAEGEPSSVTIVMVDEQGQRSFAHSQGAPRSIDLAFFRSRLELFERARCMLLGYYSLLPQLERDLPQLLAEIRERGCWTALDAAGEGGGMSPLEEILPQLDFYVPSLVEARAQTGLTDPGAIIDAYRQCGAPGVLGVKLGAHGALLSPGAGELIAVPPRRPPGPVIDTTGAGDAFYAGLLAARLRGETLERAGRIAAAAGAWCVTGLGATSELPTWEQAQ